MASTDKILRNMGAQLTATFYADGVATDADGDVTLVVTREGSDIPLFDGTADDATALDGTYEWILPPQASLMKLTLAWTGVFSAITQTVTTHAEVVGNHLFSIAEARAFRPQRGATNIGRLDDATKYPTTDIIDTREEITEFLAVALGYSPVSKYGRALIDGYGTSAALYLPESEILTVTSATVDGVALTPATDLTAWPSGRVYREGSTWTLGRRNIIVEYEYGLEIIPGEIVRAGLMLLTALLVGTDIMDRVVTHTDETGTYRLSTPDAMRNHPTGIPYVDSIINRYRVTWGVA